MSSSLSTTTTAVSASPITMASSTQSYKGKITHRSWAQLPPEIIRFVQCGICTPHLAVLTSCNRIFNRLVITHYILDVCSVSYVPHSWDTRDMWHPRMVYTVLRDANDIEKLMCICPTW